jgi:hypothetical protein
MHDAVDEIGRVAERRGASTSTGHKGGALRLARGDDISSQPSRTRCGPTSASAWTDAYQLLSKVEARERDQRHRHARRDLLAAHRHDPSRQAGARAGACCRAAGRRHLRADPGHRLDPAAPTRRCTPARGHVRANTLVLAGEAYLSQLPQTRRQVLPIYSLIVLTEPLPDDVWREIGWESRFTRIVEQAHRRLPVEDGRWAHPLRRARRALPLRLGHQRPLRPAWPHASDTARRRPRVVPAAEGRATFTHAWGGPLGVPRDYMPTMTYDPAEGIATARGYTGQGVATDQPLGPRAGRPDSPASDTALTELPTVGHRSRDWEPEPLRWIGARVVQNRLRQTRSRIGAHRRPADRQDAGGAVERALTRLPRC